MAAPPEYRSDSLVHRAWVWLAQGTVASLTVWAAAALGIALGVSAVGGPRLGVVVGAAVLGFAAAVNVKRFWVFSAERAALILILSSVLIPFSLFPPLAKGLSADDFAVLAGLAIVTVSLWRNRSRVRVPLFAWPLLLLALWALVVWTLGDGSFGALARGPVRLGIYALLVVAGALWFRSASMVRFAISSIVTISVLEALFAVFSYFAKYEIVGRYVGIEPIRAYDPIYALAPGRAVGTLGLASNFLGAYMLIPAALILGLGTIARRKRDVVAWSALYVLVFWALALTYTRASLIAVVIAAIGYFAWTRRAAMVPAFLVALISVLLLTPFVSRFGLGNDRVRLAAEAVEVIKEHPVTGVGAGEYTPDETPTTAAPGTAPTEPDRSVTPHNSFLLYASELGVLGGLLALLAVALPIVGALGRARQGTSSDEAILGVATAAGLGAFALQTLSNNLLHIPSVTVQFWVTAAIGVMVALHGNGRLAAKMALPIRLP